MGSVHHRAKTIKNATVVEETTKLRHANLRMRNAIIAKGKATHCKEM